MATAGARATQGRYVQVKELNGEAPEALWGHPEAQNVRKDGGGLKDTEIERRWPTIGGGEDDDQVSDSSLPSLIRFAEILMEWP